jgi:hypothetical protein
MGHSPRRWTPISIIRGEAGVALSQDRGAAGYQEPLAIILDQSLPR